MPTSFKPYNVKEHTHSVPSDLCLAKFGLEKMFFMDVMTSQG